MKKIFPLLLLCLVACSPETPNQQSRPEEQTHEENGNDITRILVSSPVDIWENAGARKIPVTLEPSTARVDTDVKVTCKPEDVVSYTLESDGIIITPLRVGEAVLTLSPKAGEVTTANMVKLTVNVLETEPVPASVAIRKEGADFSGGALSLTETQEYQLEATVINDKGNVSAEEVVWKVTSGDGVISIGKDGRITADAAGSATVSVSPASAPEIKDQLNVTVSALASVSVDRSLDGFEGNIFRISTGATVQLSATVKNAKGNVFATPLTWEITEGASLFHVDYKGQLTATGAQGDGKIKVSVAARPSISEVVRLRIIPLPQKIQVYGHDDAQDIQDQLRPGGTMDLRVKVYPTEADQRITVKISSESGSDKNCVLSATTTPDGEYTRVRVSFNKVSDIKYHSLIITSAAKEAVSRTARFYCFDYYETDLKVGDYVYYNTSNGKFRAEDCGRRTATGYIGGAPKTPPTVSGFNFIGVVASLSIPDDNDFLKASMLASCADNVHKSISGFRRSNLIGFDNFNGAHALVIARSHSTPMKWSAANVEIAKDNSINTYHLNPLNGVLAFSKDQASSNSGMTYVPYGFLAYRIMRRYNGLQNNANRKVLPADYVQSYGSGTAAVSVPTTSASGKSSTGWFLPGKGDLSLMDMSCRFSLTAAGCDAFPSNAQYWTTEERFSTSAITAEILGGNWDAWHFQGYQKSTTDARARAFLYL